MFFYYEVSNNNNVDVYLINPIDAVNRLSSVNHRLGSVLIGCLQEMEKHQKEINKKYADGENKKVVTDEYINVLADVLTEISSKYNNHNIVYGSHITKHNNIKLGEYIKWLEAEREINKRLIRLNEKQL